MNQSDGAGLLDQRAQRRTALLDRDNRFMLAPRCARANGFFHVHQAFGIASLVDARHGDARPHADNFSEISSDTQAWVTCYHRPNSLCRFRRIVLQRFSRRAFKSPTTWLSSCKPSSASARSTSRL
jgi:hypothetical protein